MLTPTASKAGKIAQAFVRLTDPQIRALTTTAVHVVPVAAGLLAVPLAATVSADTTAGVYTSTGWGTLQVATSTAADAWLQTAPLNGLLTAQGKVTGWALPILLAGIDESAAAGIDVFASGNAITGGNAANSMLVSVVYVSVPLL